MAPPSKRRRLSDTDIAEITKDAVKKHVAESEVTSSADAKKLRPLRSLFVRSLAPSTTTKSLLEHFSQNFPVKHATAVVDSATKTCKGYGFVTFVEAEDAEKAKEELNGSVLEGRRIKVEIAEPRSRNEGGGAGVDGEENSAKAARSEAKAARQRAKDEALQPPKLIIRNLPWSIKEPEQLATLFRSYGKVKHAVVPKKNPRVLAGFGFVVMRGRKNAEKAMQAVNGKEVDGRTLAVDWAVEKEVWHDLQNGEQDGGHTKESGQEGAQDDNEASEELDAEIGENVEGFEKSPAEDDNSPHGNDLDIVSDDEEAPSEVERIESTTKSPANVNTMFIRNLPFGSSDDSLREHFAQFGPVRYSRIVLDHVTGRPKGTGFVCFYREEDAKACLRSAPKAQGSDVTKPRKSEQNSALQHSVLQDEELDPSGRYTMGGRILQISRAVERTEATKLAEDGVRNRYARDTDKRRLYLLSEGTISSTSPLYGTLSPSEIAMREASAKQRKALIQSNPSLHVSLTRLSVRNIPRTVTSKDLKALARGAVVGFASDVKAGKRLSLSKEELARGAEEMREAEKQRKLHGKGIVKQAKVVFEAPEGTKIVDETSGGRSRGYGFIEYYTHRSALMGLRWLNGHAIGYSVKENKKASKEDVQEKKKRLIVEFAIENAQVVGRRKERETKARERAVPTGNKGANGVTVRANKVDVQNSRKRAREDEEVGHPGGVTVDAVQPADDRLAKRQRIIMKKRMLRRSRKKNAA